MSLTKAWATLLLALAVGILAACVRHPREQGDVGVNRQALGSDEWKPTCAGGLPGLVWDGDTQGESVRDCYHATTSRPVSPLSDCPGADKDGALCYPSCKEGYDGVGPVCWQNCPPGYRDDGASCFKDAKIISADVSDCPWWNKCGLGRDCSRCPEGYANDGCTCRRNPDLIWKDAYGRGAGTPMACAPGKTRIGALCYGDCPAGYAPGGPWGDIGCRQTEETCTDRVVPKQPPAPESGQWCFKVFRKGPSFVTTYCTVYQVFYGTEDLARQAAQMCCTDCTVEKIDCGRLDVCKYEPPADPTPTPTPMPEPAPEPP